MTELSEELQEAVATIKAIPAKMGLDKQSPAASAVDDNPVRSCDPNGYQLMMNKEDYEAVSAWKPEVEVTEEGDILAQAQITFSGPLNYLRYVAPRPNDELAQLEARAMDAISKGTILPAHMLQGAPFEVITEETQPTFDKEAAREEFALLDVIPTRLVAPTFELKGPPVPPPPARLLDPSFNTKDSK